MGLLFRETCLDRHLHTSIHFFTNKGTKSIPQHVLFSCEREACLLNGVVRLLMACCGVVVVRLLMASCSSLLELLMASCSSLLELLLVYGFL